MFDWPGRPDPVFTSIVTGALEFGLDDLAQLPSNAFEDAYPDLCGMFTRETAEREGRRLLEAHRSGKVFRLGAYHQFLLLQFLLDFTDVFNDGTLGEIVMGATVIRRIDIEGLLEFFGDVDFLMPLENLRKLGATGRHMMGLDDQAFNVAAGLEPHPEELAIEEVEPLWAEDPEDEDEEPNFRPGSTTYPCWCEEEDEEEDSPLFP